MIETLDIDDTRPTTIIEKLNEVIGWINHYELQHTAQVPDKAEGPETTED